MRESLLKLNCPYCQSSKVVKNGKKKNGSQNQRCRNCQEQCRASYCYKGANLALKLLLFRLLEQNSSIRDIEVITWNQPKMYAG
ncbi:hypothetical protein HUW51_17750 [Adhaeribacter swui]|uniref:InsA N-terminal zinc ribbon domain-containing protein n=1 Tax=Adhaeribacter swui TaxID=2086471 RepID=A0A7G7GBE6_9BACT|nr:hypothetical protein HUW51_17750 [Adhaeribacter swui]